MMKRLRVCGGAFSLFGCFLLSAGSALATEFCVIKKTADGFVALRAQPDAKGKLVARMKVGDEVMLNNTVDSANGWTRVYWWKGGPARKAIVVGIDKASDEGWVNAKLIADCG
jgi:hypothetical protein